MINILDEFNLLGISKKSTDKEIKLAFRRLINKFHPDKSKLPKVVATENTALIMNYYEIFTKLGKLELINKIGLEESCEDKLNLNIKKLVELAKIFENLNEDFYLKFDDCRKKCENLNLNSHDKLKVVLEQIYMTKINKFNHLINNNFFWIVDNFKFVEDILKLGESLNKNVISDFNTLIKIYLYKLKNEIMLNGINEYKIDAYNKIVKFCKDIKIPSCEIIKFEREFERFFLGKSLDIRV